jgi:hypothetical protein
MQISMRKSALKAAQLGGELDSLWDVRRWDGAGESRARSGHNCRKDRKSFRPWQSQRWGRKTLAEMFPILPIVEEDHYDWSFDWENEACYRLEYQYDDCGCEHLQPCWCQKCTEQMIIEDSPQFIRVKHGWAELV